MPEIETKEKRAKSSLNAFSGLLAFRCCRQTKYNSAAPKVRSNCEGQVSECGDSVWPVVLGRNIRFVVQERAFALVGRDEVANVLQQCRCGVVLLVCAF